MEVRPWEAETIERAKKAELELVRRLEEVERRTPNADPYVAHYSLLDKEGQKVRRMANAGQKLARGIEEEAYRRLNEGGGVGYAISMRLSAISNDPAIQNALPKHSDVIDEGQVKKLLEQLKDKAQIEPLGVSLKQESKPVDTSREGGASMEVKKPKIEFNRSGLSFEEFAQEYFRIQAEDYWAKFKLCVTLDNGYSVIVNSAQVVLEGGPSNKPRPPESIIGEVEDTRRNRKLFKDFSVVKEGTISVTIPGKKIDEIKIERVRRQQSL